MNFYYGLINEETNEWGFLEETDPRVQEGMIYLTNERWQELLQGQSEGFPICYYGGQVFNAEPGKYYLDENGWHEKTEEEFNNEKAEYIRQELVNKIYEIKADKAYGGIVINDLLVFETNQTSITNTVASLSLMQDGQIANWKFYTVDGKPRVLPITKAQLVQLAVFGQSMINECFSIEGTANIQLEQATTEQLLNDAWIETFETRVQRSMNAVNNNITINLE